MGYCMSQGETLFTLKFKNQQKALKAIQALHGKETYRDCFSWVDDDFYLRKNIIEIMNCWRWDLIVDENDTHDIIDIQFMGEKLGDENFLWGAIAPYVEPDSYITMQGEDGYTWKWVFDGKNCIEKKGKVVFED